MFKICRTCGHQWKTREAFLSDPAIEVSGYQFFFENLKQGLFLFNHSCGTTLSIEADLLLDLYDGPFHPDRNPASDRKCPGRCLNNNILNPCSDECRCAFISKTLEILKQWTRKGR
ncbi:MAG: hypothetical protein HUK40_18070 [Desulfobacter sp.]|nr:hypothetical protein [Desulfobacter sp.]WDP85854.1 MAG: hypothetical protein HUN05_12505 [Desulfobacter sp.]